MKRVVNVCLVSWCAPTAADRATSTQVTIDVLLDDLLLELLFDLYREESTRGYSVKAAWEWTTLAHVCRRWRAIIFASPRRPHLRVTCDPRTPVKTSLDIWPPFPIAITCFPFHTVDEEGEDNLLAALEHRDLISDIHIFDPKGSSVERLVVAMQEPLPALTNLYLGSSYRGPLVLPDPFLGGYAPRLRSVSLHHVAFPAFPRFVLCATHIVTLYLFEIPPSEFTSISPEVMATCLAALRHLGSLSIVFQYAPISPLQTTPPPLTRTVLPSLTDFRFMGVAEYLEDFIARLDTPLLHEFRIAFFMNFNFHTPQLHQFIGRTQSLRSLNHARVKLFNYRIKDCPRITNSFRVGPRMLRARTAAFFRDADLQYSLPLPFSGRPTLYLRGFRSGARAEERIRSLSMAGALPPVQRCAEFVCVRDTGAPCRRRSGRAHGEKADGGVTSARKSFLG